MPRGDTEKDSEGKRVGTPPPPKYADNERVLCFHGPLIYEGKTIKHQFREKEKEWAYWIHYAGWSKSWDEWVFEKRVLKYSESNLERQKELKAAHDESLRAAKTKASGKPVAKKKSLGSDTSSVHLSTTDSRSSTPVLDQKGGKVPGKGTGRSTESPVDLETTKRRRRNECVEPESHFNAKLEVEIEIPEKLKLLLVDDWDFVTRQKRLVSTPAKVTIEQILTEYVDERRQMEDNLASPLCQGIRDYLDTMLGAQLLYRFERSQYDDIMTKVAENGSKLTDYYGISHLMRLFTRIGMCLAYTNIDPEGIEVILKNFDIFFQFLLKNFDRFYCVEDYGVSCPEYQRKPT